MRHYPPEDFDPPKIGATTRKFSFIEWLIIGLVLVAGVATVITIAVERG